MASRQMGTAGRPGALPRTCTQAHPARGLVVGGTFTQTALAGRELAAPTRLPCGDPARVAATVSRPRGAALQLPTAG